MEVMLCAGNGCGETALKGSQYCGNCSAKFNTARSRRTEPSLVAPVVIALAGALLSVDDFIPGSSNPNQRLVFFSTDSIGERASDASDILPGDSRAKKDSRFNIAEYGDNKSRDRETVTSRVEGWIETDEPDEEEEEEDDECGRRVGLDVVEVSQEERDDEWLGGLPEAMPDGFQSVGRPPRAGKHGILAVV